jgi:DNA-binding CsgD family transcriptional regulator
VNVSSRETLTALKDLVERLSSSVTVDDIGRALLATGNRFGFVDELIIDMGKLLGRVGPAIIFTIHPPAEVVEHDAQSPFANHPFTLRARASPQPFLMSDVRRAMGLEGDDRWWAMMPESLNGMDGIVVPIYDQGALAWCAAFAGREPDFSAAAQATMSAAVQAGYALYLELLDPKTARSRLSERESDCLRLLAEGMSDADIGAALGIAPRTVRYHLGNAKQKLGVATRIQAVARSLGR